MTVAGLDSSFDKPTDAQLDEAWNAGVRFWALYMATKPEVGLASVATREDFARIKAHGMGTLAYVSGWDDPQALRAQAADWGIAICLDVESEIRGDGSWVQGFLDASGAGLYGNAPVHWGRRAPFYIASAYPGGLPAPATWPPRATPPPGPHGWQCQNTHTEFGCSVDRGWYDDFFATLSRSAPAPPADPPAVHLGENIAVKRIPITITTDGNGNGWDNQYKGRGVAWSSCVGAPFLNGSDPDLNADKAYWPGFAKAQQRDGLLLVEVIGARPNTTETVWQDVNE